MQLKNKKFLFIGFIASLSLLILYFLILSLANSFSHAVEQFFLIWYWILILVAGFGIQVGLYTFVRQSQKIASKKVLVASGGISTGSMIACCLHHLSDVLPLIGVAVISTFLIQYQLFFIIIGILANLIGIILMLEIIQKNNLPQCSILKRILIYNMSQVKKIAIIFSLVLLPSVFLLSSNQGSKGKLIETINLPPKADNQAGIEFEVTPLDFNFGNPVKFEIKIDTHSGSLDFDLAKISILEDDLGNQYLPTEWQGLETGGHHRSGILLFPKIDSSANKLKLIIKDNFQRGFEWGIKW